MNVIKKFKIVLFKKKMFVVNVKNIMQQLELHVHNKFQIANLNNLLMDALNAMIQCIYIIKHVIMIFINVLNMMQINVLIVIKIIFYKIINAMKK